MANEGSTKPTYSELEAELLRVRGLLQRQWISVEERLPEDEDSSVWVCFENGSHYCSARYIDEEWFGYDLQIEDTFHIEQKITHWMPLQKPPNFPHSSSLVSQGAESADIGKLDSADKKHVCGQMGFNPSLGDTCAGCEARKVGVDKSGVEMAKNIPPDLAKNGDLKDGYCAGVFDAIAELDKEKP